MPGSSRIFSDVLTRDCVLSYLEQTGRHVGTAALHGGHCIVSTAPIIIDVVAVI